VTERTPIPLSIHHTPICITFAIFDDGDRVVMDPTLLESRVQTGEMTISLNIHREVCMISKAGGTPISVETLMRCANAASNKVIEIGEMLASRSKQDKLLSK
jgi:exosome complex component RRP45